MVYSLTWLPEVLESAGLKVAEHPGWRTRGRGEMGPVRGIICHHTAGASAAHGVMPSLNTIVNGRAATAKTKALAGPLAQLALARDGTWIVVAAGRANHAGGGDWRGCVSGNSNMIGIEAENTGLANDSPWPDVQLDAYRRGVAAILKKIGGGPDQCCGHKEYALPKGRKSDPNFDMDAFRDGVAEIMNGSAMTRPLIPAVDSSLRSTLRRGARGELVKQMQRKLKLADDGIFGPATEAAVRAFQRKLGLVPDGIVGPMSWQAIDKL